MRLGCHAVLFKDRIKTETEEILKGLAATGFKGVEIGSRFFGIDEKDKLVELLNKYDMEVTGIHIGNPLKEWADNGQESHEKIMKVADFIKDMPNKNIIMSGSKAEGANLEAAARNIEETVKKCSAMGVTLNYHNHEWEFVDGAEVFNTLIKFAPTLKFGLDIGWVYRGGVDPLALLKEHSDRISYVHLRDVDNRSIEDRNFPELGEGLFDYDLLMKTVNEILGENDWAIVEYERGEEDFGRYAKAREVIRGLGY